MARSADHRALQRFLLSLLVDLQIIGVPLDVIPSAPTGEQNAPGWTPLRTLGRDGSGCGSGFGLGVGFGFGSPLGFGLGARKSFA